MKTPSISSPSFFATFPLQLRLINWSFRWFPGKRIYSNFLIISLTNRICGLAGAFNVVCDVTEQTVTVSSNLSPRLVVSLIRQVMGSAHIINYVDPLQPTFVTPQDRVRYTSYDDSYSYASRTGYAPAYTLPYNGRSYDNEFRPGGYGGRYGSSFY